MKIHGLLIMMGTTLILSGCMETKGMTTATIEEKVIEVNEDIEEVNIDLQKDVLRFVELYVKFQSVSNVETATNNQIAMKNAGEEGYEELHEMLMKYNTYMGNSIDIETSILTMRNILENYLTGLDYYIEGVEYYNPSSIEQGFRMFVEVNSQLEALTKELGVPFTVGVQTSEEADSHSPGLLEAVDIRTKLEEDFGKQISVRNVLYEKFSSVNQYNFEDQRVLSLEVITNNFMTNDYGEHRYKPEIKDETEDIFKMAFENKEVDRVGLTFLIDFNGTILPTYSIAMHRDEYESLDFGANDFELILNFFGSDFSQTILTGNYETVVEKEVVKNSDVVMELVIKEETVIETETQEQMNDLLEKVHEYWGEMNAQEWGIMSDNERTSLVQGWIDYYESQGGEMLEDAEWFVMKINEAIDFYGTSISENGDTTYVVIGNVIFQYQAFGGFVSSPYQ